MFRNLRVKNFRAITNLSVDGLSRVNLFVGHNACGKTTLLEGVFFLMGATNPKLPANLMGGGIMKLLNTALAMLNMQDGFVLLDEIENGLDYSSQRKLWDAIFSWAQRLNVQVFASTHSMECIKAFSDCAEAGLFGMEAKRFRIERTGDKFRTVEYTRELLAESLDSSWEVR